MKTHNTLKELLKDFLNEYFDRTVNNGNETDEVVLTDFVASNNLALGKQKPLAKNKECDKSCDCHRCGKNEHYKHDLCEFCYNHVFKNRQL